MKADNNKNIQDNILFLLKSMAKENNKSEAYFKKTLKNFDPSVWINRYFIHWIACQFPKLLQGVDYRAFLEKNAFEHFDFKSIKKQ